MFYKSDVDKTMPVYLNRRSMFVCFKDPDQFLSVFILGYFQLYVFLVCNLFLIRCNRGTLKNNLRNNLKLLFHLDTSASTTVYTNKVANISGEMKTSQSITTTSSDENVQIKLKINSAMKYIKINSALDPKIMSDKSKYGLEEQ